MRRWWHSFWRGPSGRVTWKAAVASVGVLVIAAGIALLPLPGPGWLVIFAGLAVLATEFSWARRLLDFARKQVAAWTAWVVRQSLFLRLSLALGGLLVAGATLWAGLAVLGTPAWLPEGAAEALRLPGAESQR